MKKRIQRKEEKNLKFVFLIGFFLIMIPLVLAIPQSFTINGRLTNPNGVAEEGNYSINFTIYDAVTNGNALWTSTQDVATDSNGVYSAQLNANLNYSENYYLSINVAEDGEMSPRINLTSSPYAFRAQNINVSGVEFDSNVDLGSYNLTTTGVGDFGSLQIDNIN